jgi:predicted ATP-dependent endonuclease of OLD family
MYLSRLRVKSYKSFHDSGDLFFKPGINVIVGPNNSGKTALLEALSLRINNHPHHSVETSRSYKAFYATSSFIEFAFAVDAEEVNDPKFFNHFDNMTVPTPADGRIEKALIELTKARAEGFYIYGTASEKGVNTSVDFGLYKPKQSGLTDSHIHVNWEGGKYVQASGIGGSEVKNRTAYKQLMPLVEKIYRFEAERMRLSQSQFREGSAQLLPNAENLPEVLHVLQTVNPAKYRRLIKLVTDVIPSVKWVSAYMNPDKLIGVNIWPLEQETERDDLAIGLSEAGTGIGQVLAILYVVFTSDEPRTIIIDEPQAFLHPGAIRKLMEILQSYSQHQYFISTHSPDILSISNPSTITALQYEGGISSAKSLDLNQTSELRDVLNEIGVRFGEVFFAKDILWVEGQTEALAFPLILRQSDQSFSGITILPLVNTGDLKSKKHVKKHAQLVFDIYSKLSGTHALAPPVVGIILDRDETTPQEMKELKRLSTGLLEFLPRRMFENYLLDPEAIAEVANAQEGFSEAAVESEQIDDWINNKRANGAYLSEKLNAKKDSLSEHQWLVNVDGAKLLEDLFRHFSGVVEYRKTKHSVELASWLVENKPNSLKELTGCIASVLRREKPEGESV